jgi:hypothetical protein
MDLENRLKFIIEFELLNYNLRFVVNENEFYVKKKEGWRLKKFTDNGKGYLRANFRFEKNKRTIIYKHRLVFFAYNKDFEIFRRSTTENFIDHADGDKLNNKIENLRIVTNQQNNFNRKRARGYYWNKKVKKWKAEIQLDGKKKHLGLFENEQEAHQAYLTAKPLYHIFN